MGILGSRYGYVPPDYNLPDHPHFRWVRQVGGWSGVQGGNKGWGKCGEKPQCVRNLWTRSVRLEGETQAEGSVSGQVLDEGIPLRSTSQLAKRCEGYEGRSV